MTFIETVPEGDASGDVAQMYETDRAAHGHVPNFTKAFSHRPGVYAAWRALNGEIKAGMDLRRYELATVAAARRLARPTARWPMDRCWSTSSSSPTS